MNRRTIGDMIVFIIMMISGGMGINLIAWAFLPEALKTIQIKNVLIICGVISLTLSFFAWDRWRKRY